MNKIFSTILTLLFVSTLYLPTSFGEDYTQWGLPEGAKVRIGKGTISEMAYSPDGTRLAVASGAGTWLYDTQTYQELRLLNNVHSVLISPDGKMIAAIEGSYIAGGSPIISLYDADTGTVLRRIIRQLPEPIINHPFKPGTNERCTRVVPSSFSSSDLEFSPDGKMIAAGGYSSIDLYDVNTGEILRSFRAADSRYVGSYFAFSPNGKILASVRHRSSVGGVDLDASILFWDVTTSTLLRTIFVPESHQLYHVIFSPDGKTLVNVEHTLKNEKWDSTILLWDADTGTLLRSLTWGSGQGYKDHITSLTISPDGKTLVSTHVNGPLRLWDINIGKIIRTIPLVDRQGSHFVVHGGSNVAVHPDGKKIATASNSGVVDIWDDIWDVDTGTLVRTITGHTGWTYEVAFHPNGKKIATAGSEGYIRLWDPSTGRRLNTIIGHGSNVSSVAFSPNGETLLSGSYDHTIRLWDANTGNYLRSFIGHTNSVYSVAFSPNGKIIASGSSDKTIRLWDVTTGTLLQKITGHTFAIDKVIFSSDGQTLASSSQDRTVRLWDVATGTQLHTLRTENSKRIYGIVFRPDGKTLAAGDGDGVRLWDVDTGTLLQSIFIGAGAVAFSPNGKILTCGSHILDVDTGNVLHRLPEGVFSIAFSPDGKTIITAGYMANNFVWELDLLPPIPEYLPEDVHQDGVVDIRDLVLVARYFGESCFGSRKDRLRSDVNSDGIVNILDLLLVAAAMKDTASAPTVWRREKKVTATKADIEAWLREARQVNSSDPIFQRGLLILEHLLASFALENTTLHANYPNPFNPETWIPYQLAAPANVSISIHAADGKLVRSLSLGKLPAGTYQDRSRAAHWDGKNELGEAVASGIYFYTLTADDFTSTRKMLIQR